MKKIILAVAILAGFAGTASAFELGSTGVMLDNTTTAGYDQKADDFFATHELNVNYEVATDVSLYAETTVDLTDVKYDGIEIGVDWAVMDSTTVSAFTVFDGDGKNTSNVAQVEFKF